MKRLFVASAGGGKTSFLVKSALEFTGGRVLVTTFTNANEDEIKKRIYKNCGYYPPHIVVQSWWSFLLEHGARPYQTSLYEKDIGGIAIVEGKSGFRFMIKGKIPVYYGEKDFEKFYFSSNSSLYYDKVAQFVLRCDEANKGKVFSRIEKCFQMILIDEIQDFSGYDLEILKKFFNLKSEVVLVGDPRQGTYSTSNSSKNRKFRKSEIVHFFEDKSLRIEVDDTTLSVNHRCVAAICNFSNLLYPNLKPATSGNSIITGHDGIFFIHPNDVSRYISAYSPVQLRYNIKTKTDPRSEAMNFGVSKGLEFNRVLIYPTSDMAKWIENHDHKLNDTTRSQLYVALTRGRQSSAVVGCFKNCFKVE